ncbi:MAG: hypothetical protein HOH43_25955 [Candidatus Latescibacteria bacterium]|jgi:hypothetical protein|nr:hypothetical protein [Candidatus Latescibacterota bacterium]
MSHNMIRLVVLGIVVVFTACQDPPPPAPIAGPLEGAWKIVEWSGAGADTSWTQVAPQPSLYLFGKEYYSVMYINGTEARALFEEGTPGGTDAEKVAGYNTFIANSGSYAISGTNVTTSPMVAKWPNYMTGDQSATFAYRVEGDNLWLENVSNTFTTETPSIIVTTKLERIE